MIVDMVAKYKAQRGRGRVARLLSDMLESEEKRKNSPVPLEVDHTIELGGNEYNLFFGDIHGHSDLSPDGYFFSPDHFYEYGRNIARLDFAALTDHDAPWGMREHPERWEELCGAAERHCESGEFVTFVGYEWTSGDGLVCQRHTLRRKPRYAYLDDPLHFGHRNVYFPSGDVPDACFSNDDERYNTPEKLWEAIEPYGAITIPHHPLGGPVFPFDWNHFNEDMEPVVEIYSGHGSSECEGAAHEIYNPYHNGRHSVRRPLDDGRHFGFIASSDCHQGRAGNFTFPFFLIEWCRLFYGGTTRPPGPGLCAAYAGGLSRDSIFNAIRNRRTYAVTGARIIMDVRADGHFMGERFSAGDSEVTVSVYVKAVSDMASVELIKNGTVVKEWKSPGRELDIDYKDEKRDTDSDYIYVRVTQKDLHMAWSSPIRLDK